MQTTLEDSMDSTLPAKSPKSPAHVFEIGVVSTEAYSVSSAMTPKPALIETNTFLKRGLRSRHLQMIAMGGTIGTGLFIGSGAALSHAGPVGALLAYLWVGSLVFSVMLSLGEMATYLPVSGAFTAYASRFVDESLGFAMGWIYWFSWAATFAVELTAIGLIIEFWNPNISIAIFIVVFWVLVTGVNLLPVKVYGELEFWAASIKVLTIVGFMFLAICIDAGVGDQGYLGFKYWRDPGPFSSYLVSGATGRFVGFWATLIQAGFSYQGTELVGIAIAEVQNPRISVPSAIRKTFVRILIFYCGTVLFIGLVIPKDNQDLLSSASDAAASPFVIAAHLAGINALPSIINAVLLTVVISAANSNVYSASRILVGLATSGLAPRSLGVTNRHGVPYVAVTLTASVGLLAFLNLSAASGTVFTWLISVSGVAGYICWCSISISYIRFHHACRRQGLAREELPYRTPWQPWISYYGCAFMILITITQGFTCFIPWSTSSFFINYISLIVFLLLYTGHKIMCKTKIASLDTMDLVSGRREGPRELIASRKEKTWLEKIVSFFL